MILGDVSGLTISQSLISLTKRFTVNPVIDVGRDKYFSPNILPQCKINVAVKNGVVGDFDCC